MSIHIDAPRGAVAEAVLLPGDPLRATYVAERWLEGAQRFNGVRCAYGYTGTWRGARVSVQATGMGVPSAAIYVHELVADYGAKVLVRVGTCGALREDLRVGDVVLAQAACTNSAFNRATFGGADFAPVADWGLLRRADDLARARGLSVRVGNVLTSDVFYDQGEWWRPWADHGVLAAEMEVAGLYTLAARHGVRALAVLTVSDHVLGGASLAPAERERTLDAMLQLGLDVAAGT